MNVVVVPSARGNRPANTRGELVVSGSSLREGNRHASLRQGQGTAGLIQGGVALNLETARRAGRCARGADPGSGCQSQRIIGYQDDVGTRERGPRIIDLEGVGLDVDGCAAILENTAD